MTNTRLKRLFACSLIIIFMLLLISACDNIKRKKEVRFFEIKGTGDTYLLPPPEQVIVEKYYVINGSRKLTHEELKAEIEEFIDSQMATLKAERESDDEPNYEGLYELRFFRESIIFTRNWKPRVKYWFVRETIVDHYDDLIAYVIYSDEDDLTQMLIYENSKRIGTFGTLDRMYSYYDNCLEYINDSPVFWHDEFNIIYPDTDDDGISNKDEIEHGTDPFIAE